jgi:NAD(P)-dependent dehydrogenase (short-subunit alcohol dehydrogenase family)
VVFGLTDFTAIEREIGAFIARHGQLDVLVCNAGMRDRRVFLETDSETLRDVLETNLVANFEMARLVTPHMIERGRGKITSSPATPPVAGRAGAPRTPRPKAASTP